MQQLMNKIPGGGSAISDRINPHTSQNEDTHTVSFTGTPSIFSHTSNLTKEDAQQQMSQMMRQKDLLDKLQQEKELIRLQMQYNERVMESRMAHLAEEKCAVERKVDQACVTI